MFDADLINTLRAIRHQHSYTLHELSVKLYVQISTLQRWLKSGRINRLYAKTVREKLGIG